MLTALPRWRRRGLGAGRHGVHRRVGLDLLQALDDPFVRLTPPTRTAILANPHITLIETPHGGHCAYLCEDEGDGIHWAESTVTRYLLRFAARGDGS